MWLGTLNGSVFLVDPENEKVIKKIDGPGSLVRTICTSHNEISEILTPYYKKEVS
jgi:hypothetical protein